MKLAFSRIAAFFSFILFVLTLAFVLLGEADNALAAIVPSGFMAIVAMVLSPNDKGNTRN